MKEYIYTPGDEKSKVLIRDFEEENYILLVKEDQPPLKITKHLICIVGASVENMNIKVSKAENFVKAVRKNIIQEGLKNGTCKAV